MRVGKSQCSVFKELYPDFLKGEVEKETKDWMEQHKKECTYCREWAKSFEENKEDIIENKIIKETALDRLEKIIKKAKMTKML